jgi:hypothetical protein
MRPSISFALLVATSPMALAPLGCDGSRVLDERSERALVATPVSAPRAESDEPLAVQLELSSALGRQSLGVGRGGLLLPGGAAVVLDEERRLVLHGPARQRPRLLLEDVLEVPALLPDGRLLATRATDLGESDLWLVRLDGEPPRALAAAPGADGQPLLLGDGRALFVSDRTGVAAVFFVGLDGSGLRQLTNQSARPGALGAAFVAPPVAWLRVEQHGAATRVVYDAGDHIVALDVDSGAAEVLR